MQMPVVTPLLNGLINMPIATTTWVKGKASPRMSDLSRAKLSKSQKDHHAAMSADARLPLGRRLARAWLSTMQA